MSASPLDLRGSISLRMYPHLELDAPGVIKEMCAQAAIAAAHGFDGVMTSEHHGGFAGYLPNPLQSAGFLLEAMPRGWAAACPLLAPLRPAALIVEETAWLAARYPGRVALGLAAGALASDFEAMDLDMRDLTARFTRSLTLVARALRGEVDGVLAGDPAITRCRDEPVPVLSAAASTTAAQRAARVGAGILLDSLSTVQRCRALIDAYREAGGAQACVLIRRVWIGAPPRTRFDDQVGVYRTYAGASAQASWGDDELLTDDDPAVLVARIVDVVHASGADALNVRVHVPGVDAASVRAQIERLAADVLPGARKALGGGSRVP